MNHTIDMKHIRYLNLFEKITGVSCKNCFSYNNQLIFAVPSALVSRAIGEDGRNVKELVPIMRSKIKIVSIPKDISDIEKFIIDIVSPANFNSLEITDNEIIISGNTQSKATLIGRNKARLKELQKIIKDFFGKELRIA